MKQDLITFAGNHLGDATRTANLFDFAANPIYADGNRYLTAASSQPGVLTGPVGWMSFIPQTEPGVSIGGTIDGTLASLVVQTTPTTGGNLAIKGLPGTPNAGYKLVFVQGIPMIQLDCSRSLLLGVMGAITPTLAFNFYASGADRFGQLMTVTKTVVAGSGVNTAYDLFKGFSCLKSAMVSAATGAPIWLGVGPTFSMDYYIPRQGCLTNVSYNNIPLARQTVFMVPPLVGNPLNLTPAPTATSNDVRGAIRLNSNPLTSNMYATGASLEINYIIHGATAQVRNVYNLATNTWSQASDDVCVLNTLGSAQYYNSSLA